MICLKCPAMRVFSTLQVTSTGDGELALNFQAAVWTCTSTTHDDGLRTSEQTGVGVAKGSQGTSTILEETQLQALCIEEQSLCHLEGLKSCTKIHYSIVMLMLPLLLLLLIEFCASHQYVIILGVSTV